MEELVAARTALGLNQVEAARLLGMNSAWLSQLERNESRHLNASRETALTELKDYVRKVKVTLKRMVRNGEDTSHESISRLVKMELEINDPRAADAISRYMVGFFYVNSMED
jgi:transcriptional regulator with XRE-family HTH domain